MGKRKKEEEKKSDAHKTELLCLLFFFRVRFPKAWGGCLRFTCCYG